jgi:hypothetical protein
MRMKNFYTGAVACAFVRTASVAVALVLWSCADSSTNSQSSGGAGGKTGTSGTNGKTGEGGSRGPSQTATSSCTKVCSLAESLHCPNDPTPCLSECIGLYDSTVCQSELRAMIACSSSVPASDWMCWSDGQSDVKPELCKTERDAVDKCLSK